MAQQKSTTVITTQKLNARQQKALEVLLVGGSDQQAADAAGVARTTVTQWRSAHSAFALALSAAKRELLRRTSSRLHAATSVAVRALEDVARDTKVPAARVSAARAILELSHKALELEDIQRRLEELETWFEEQKALGQG